MTTQSIDSKANNPEQIYLSPPHMGEHERELLLQAFDSNWVAPLGPFVDRFEADVARTLGVRRAVALSSGSAALHLALRVLGVGPSDSVIVPTLTFAATANAVRYVGAEPVFIDCAASTWTIDPALLEEELCRRHRAGRPVAAVLAVDLYGQCCDYDAVAAACDRYGALLIVDAAESLGSTYRGRAAGTFGAAGVLSFNGNKILTTSGGGMLLTDDDHVADTAHYLATQARDPVAHYEHREVGYNYRLSNLLAAVGCAQLEQLADRVQARRQVRSRYAAAFSSMPGVELMPVASYGDSNCWLTCLLVDDAAFGATAGDVCRELNAQHIEARPTWKPMHLQPVYAESAVVGGSVSEDIFRRGICLPSGSSLTHAQQDRVIGAVLSVPERRGGPRP